DPTYDLIQRNSGLLRYLSPLLRFAGEEGGEASWRADAQLRAEFHHQIVHVAPSQTFIDRFIEPCDDSRWRRRHDTREQRGDEAGDATFDHARHFGNFRLAFRTGHRKRAQLPFPDQREENDRTFEGEIDLLREHALNRFVAA